MKFLFIAITLIVYSTCSNTGIFYALENEEKILESNNLNNATQFTHMVQTDDYYLGNGGLNIFVRNKDNSNSSVDDWSTITLPTGVGDSVSGTYSSDLVVSDMVLVGTHLVISVISYNDSNIISGIYRLNSNATTFDYANNTETWEMLTKSNITKGVTDVSYYKLFSAQSNLFVNVLSYGYDGSDDDSPTLNGSDLYRVTSGTISGMNNNLAGTASYSTDLINFAMDSSSNPMYSPIIALDSAGGNYWMIINGDSEGSIYSNATGDFTNANVISSTLDNKFVDIFAIDTTRFLVSNTTGSMHIYNGTFIEKTKGSNYINGFVDISLLQSNTILVGTTAAIGDSTYDGTGYSQLDISDVDENNWDWDASSESFTDTNNYNSSDLSDASINGFLYDSTNQRIFAYTTNDGVWMNEDEDSTRQWSLE